MLSHVTGGRGDDGYSDDILEAQGGEWTKVGNSPGEDLVRDYPSSIFMTLQNTVIIELNCYFLCQ